MTGNEDRSLFIVRQTVKRKKEKSRTQVAPKANKCPSVVFPFRDWRVRRPGMIEGFFHGIVASSWPF